MSVVERIRLVPGSDEYQEISKLFEVKCTTKKHHLEVQTIEKVFNDSLLNKFYAKEQEYLSKYGHVKKVKLFHGTKKSNISSILRSNFEVSRHGQHIGHRFGAGVSFSAQASYASHYCDNSDVDYMILCDILISNIVEVPESKNNLSVLHEPPYIPGMGLMRYDTTAKNKAIMDVIVKFENDTYYPAYVITFKRRAHTKPLMDWHDDVMEQLIMDHARRYLENLKLQ